MIVCFATCAQMKGFDCCISMYPPSTLRGMILEASDASPRLGMLDDDNGDGDDDVYGDDDGNGDGDDEQSEEFMEVW